ncbi:nitroreductase (macronuclear) [Tetrahymena thermophila SB210]|uniref:Nitroreductase n=1 Tax=Tetrahymena thermophila (strain SB210) TaxID=312017 RepID=I7MD02_TETTS|nr:nitroreductase [Tetrahymena thermophila SB210]EAR85243.1 nitroreductase [Tetrahymena thermophila SB210]|eukprot:XP_001032906.1 nitroreductase [Tetrahymena thermophila SB210]
MNNQIIYIAGGILLLNGVLKKYAKDYIKDFFKGRAEDQDQQMDLLIDLLITCFVTILSCSYYILTQSNKDTPQQQQQPKIDEPKILESIMKKRRSITPKDYNDQLIDDQDIHHILECANTAPTHGKNEPWRFVVYKRETLNQFFTFVKDWYKQNGQKIFSNDEEREKTLKQIENKFSEISKASHIILLCMKRYASEKNVMPEWEEIAAVATSVQNIYLQTAAKGFGGYWSSMTFARHARDSKEMRQFLNLNHDEDRVFGSFVIGKVDDLSKFTRIPGDYKKKVEFR